MKKTRQDTIICEAHFSQTAKERALSQEHWVQYWHKLFARLLQQLNYHGWCSSYPCGLDSWDVYRCGCGDSLAFGNSNLLLEAATFASTCIHPMVHPQLCLLTTLITDSSSFVLIASTCFAFSKAEMITTCSGFSFNSGHRNDKCVWSWDSLHVEIVIWHLVPQCASIIKNTFVWTIIKYFILLRHH